MGARYVFEALAENGFQELALDISTSVEQPSFDTWPCRDQPAERGLELCGRNGWEIAMTTGGSKNHPMFTGGIECIA